MELREYLFRNEMKCTAFGEKIGYAGNYIAAIARRQIKPGKKLAKLIAEVTQGQVVYEIKDDRRIKKYCAECLKIRQEQKKQAQAQVI